MSEWAKWITASNVTDGLSVISAVAQRSTKTIHAVAALSLGYSIHPDARYTAIECVFGQPPPPRLVKKTVDWATGTIAIGRVFSC